MNFKFIISILFIFLSKSYVHALPNSATYIVPIDESELASFATFPIEDFSISLEKIKISMPMELVPSKNYKVEFLRSKENPNLFNSVVGQANCLSTTPDSISCKVVYNKLYSNYLKSNLESTKKFLEDTTSSNFDLLKKIQIATLFSNDPIGKIVIKLRNRQNLKY